MRRRASRVKEIRLSGIEDKDAIRDRDGTMIAVATARPPRDFRNERRAINGSNRGRQSKIRRQTAFRRSSRPRFAYANRSDTPAARGAGLPRSGPSAPINDERRGRARAERLSSAPAPPPRSKAEMAIDQAAVGDEAMPSDPVQD